MLIVLTAWLALNLAGFVGLTLWLHKQLTLVRIQRDAAEQALVRTRCALVLMSAGDDNARKFLATGLPYWAPEKVIERSDELVRDAHRYLTRWRTERVISLAKPKGDAA